RRQRAKPRVRHSDARRPLARPAGRRARRTRARGGRARSRSVGARPREARRHRRPRATPARAPPRDPREGGRMTGRPITLVVDDERDEVEIARRSLAARFDVEAVPTAAEGLEKLKSGRDHFALVVLDYRLGDSNALAFLRESARTGEGPPVI